LALAFAPTRGAEVRNEGIECILGLGDLGGHARWHPARHGDEAVVVVHLDSTSRFGVESATMAGSPPPAGAVAQRIRDAGRFLP
jgi:hypothetical protein